MPEAPDPDETLPFTGPQLAELCRSLLRISADANWPEPPLLLALPWNDPWRVDDEGFDVETLPLSGVDEPLEVLCRLGDRPEVAVFGIVSEGWAVTDESGRGVDWDRLHLTGPLPSRHPRGRRVRVLNAAARSGAAAVALSSETAVTAHGVDDGGSPGGPAGPLCDGLRRLFGLATPPCPVPVIELWTVYWLERVLTASPRARTWDEVVALHPLVPALTQASIPVGADTVEAVVGTRAAMKSWGKLHAFASTDGWGGVSQAVAAWSDEPMFARLVLRDQPPLWLVLGQVEEQFPAEIGRALRRLLARWGLDPDGLAA